MKESERLRMLAQQEDNDLVAMGVYKKVIREERKENFEGYKDAFLLKGYDLTECEVQGKITINPTALGVIDYYPKANKVLIRKQNTWKPQGLKWLIENLLH